jgi:four helix bundle protein
VTGVQTCALPILSQLAKRLPKEEKYRLSDQIIRASRSVTANIAEGFGRFHHQENIQFCRQARGSLMELIDHLSVTLDENYITKE